MLVEYHASGDPQKILAYGEEVLALARELGLEELMGFALSNLSLAYMAQEQFEAARKANSEAQSTWLALGNLPMVADSFTIKMGIQRFTGDYEALLATVPEALSLNLSIGNLWHQNQAHNLQSVVHGLQGRLGQALAIVERAMAISEEIGNALIVQGDYWSLTTIYLLVLQPYFTYGE
jgi:tetratricopeptide (TPR) repeat protein